MIFTMILALFAGIGDLCLALTLKNWEIPTLVHKVRSATNHIQKKNDGLRISAFGSKLRYASISSHHMNDIYIYAYIYIHSFSYIPYKNVNVFETNLLHMKIKNEVLPPKVR